jgi:pimeloyl-ACP methyl ester carboxylesterase
VRKVVNICEGILISILMSSSAIAADEIGKVIDDPAYTHAQRLIEVEPGRRLNLYCSGEGAPTVVFVSGLADDTSAWARVQPAIAAHTRACSYDRAGISYSDAGRRPADSANIVDDLHRLLNAASIKPPYILVGHSMGGMHARLYADSYLTEVAGMVLVDSADEDVQENMWRLDPLQPTHEQAFALDPKEVEQQRDCIKAAQLGFVEGSESYKNCVPPYDPRYSDAINESLHKAYVSLGFQQAAISEQNTYQESSDEVRAARRWYGDMPLIVLYAPPRARREGETQAHRDAVDRVKLSFQDRLVALSKRGIVRLVPNATHEIQKTQPDTVIKAILEVLKDAREPKEHGQAARHQ